MKTDSIKIKVTKRVSGFSALLTYPWGEKVRFSGLSTKDQAAFAAAQHVERRRQYTLDKDLGLTLPLPLAGKMN